MASTPRPEVQRPLSPHLQVYRPQLTSVLSITHRATGVANALLSLGLVWWLLALMAGPGAYARFTAFFGSVVGQVLLVAATFSLMYHLCNGVRHLFWDTGRGLDIATAYRSGYAVIAGSLLLTVAIWAYVLMGGAA